MVREVSAHRRSLVIDRAHRPPVFPLQFCAVPSLVFAKVSKDRLESFLEERMSPPVRDTATPAAETRAFADALKVRGERYSRMFWHRP